MFFTRSLYPSIRRNLFKLAKLPVVSEHGRNLFNNRVTNIWNWLPDNIVATNSILSFKRTLMNLIFPIFFCSNNFVLAT